jgi:hypothetical protein
MSGFQAFVCGFCLSGALYCAARGDRSGTVWLLLFSALNGALWLIP